jgi:cobalt/nickel transport system permease protein
MSCIHRAPAGLKLGASLVLIMGLAALPAGHAAWGLCALPPLLLITVLARLELKTQLLRLAFALPFLLGVASLAAFQPHGLRTSLGLFLKSALSLFTLQLLGSTTSSSELLRVLRRISVPEPLCDAMLLLARYSSLLIDEARRMRRARAGRTLRASRWLLWRALGSSLGLLFVRTVSRAERVQIAMRSRGGG